MELNLKKENINYVKAILNTSFTQEETMEMIVPDALPDILRVVDTDATIFMRGKEAETERVSVSGVVGATILYCPDGETGIRRLELSIPFTGNASGEDISNNTKVTANISLCSIHASIINPRKILIRTEILFNISCFNEENIGISKPPEEYEDPAVEMLCGNFDMKAPVSIKEKTFTISDEYSVPSSSLPIGEILKTKVILTSDDAKTVGSKLIFRGRAQVSMLYRPADGGEINDTEFVSEFSQIMELDDAKEEKSFDIKLMLTGMYIDKPMSSQMSDDRTVAAELHIVAQCVASAKIDISYIADTYSTKYALASESENLQFMNMDSDIFVKETFREILETTSNVRNIISTNIHTGAVSQTMENGRLMLKTPMNVSAVYAADDGRLLSESKTFEIKSSTDAHTDSSYIATVMNPREIYAIPSGQGIDVRLTIDFHIVQTSQNNIRPISNISYNEDEPRDLSDKPSLIIHRVLAQDSLWKLAKNYNSTPDLIESANEIGDSNSLSQGQLLIIPKRR